MEGCCNREQSDNNGVAMTASALPGEAAESAPSWTLHRKGQKCMDTSVGQRSKNTSKDQLTLLGPIVTRMEQ